MPGDPGRVLAVTLTTPQSAVTVRADRYRGDLQKAGLADGCYGFAVAVDDLPGYRLGVKCTWNDLDLPLPGSPWRPPENPGATFVCGAVRLRVDAPTPGDLRLTGYVFDVSEPLHRIRIGLVRDGQLADSAVASLYRKLDDDGAGDAFHGFVLSLSAPLCEISAGVSLIDVASRQVLAQLGPQTF